MMKHSDTDRLTQHVVPATYLIWPGNRVAGLSLANEERGRDGEVMRRRKRRGSVGALVGR